MTSSLKLFIILYYTKQIDSKLPCVCSVIDHRGRQNVVRTSLLHSAAPRMPLLFSRQLGIYLLMNEPLIEKHAISTGLSNVNREKHTRKSHRVCRRDRETSRISIRSSKRLRNKSRKIRKFAYARILSCIPMSST